MIGIDASYFLRRLLYSPGSKEPLLSALGGFPFALTHLVEIELNALKSHGIDYRFVFNGLDAGKKDDAARQLSIQASTNIQAWELYDRQQADQVVEAFGSSGASIPCYTSRRRLDLVS